MIEGRTKVERADEVAFSLVVSFLAFLCQSGSMLTTGCTRLHLFGFWHTVCSLLSVCR